MATWNTKYDGRGAGSELSITGESHVVGEDLANYVLLNEVPLQETPSTVAITYLGVPFTENSSAPAAGEYQVIYSGALMGGVLFNVSDAGKTVVCSYKGRGSNVFARDINKLQSLKLDADGAVPLTGALQLANGTAAAPSLTFASDLDTGLYRVGANSIGVAVAGVNVGTWASTGLAVAGLVAATTLSGDGSAITNLAAANLTGTIGSARLSGSYTGITGLGTVTVGVWNGTAIADAYIASGLDVTKLTTGSTLPSNVTASSLTSVGNLAAVTVIGTSTLGLVTATSVTVTKAGAPLAVNNTSAAAVNAALSGQRGGSQRWALGFTAADIFALLDSAGTTANLTVTDLGALTVRAGITATTATFSGALTVTGGGAAITGTVTATAFSGDGSSLTALNATSLSTGTVASGRVTGSYTGITGLGTITVGVWNGTAIGDTYLATGISGSKISGNIAGNAANITAFIINQDLGTGSAVVFSKMFTGTSAAVTTALASAVAAGNGFEFGHTNSSGYRNVLGSDSSSGAAFLAFHAEAGTSANTYKTRGIRGSIFRSNVNTTATGGGFEFVQANNTSADNQTATMLASLDAGGNWNTLGAITQNGSQVLTAGNFTTYAPSLTGSGASGTWGIAISGNAATASSATKLTTARLINGVAFDGTADISISTSAAAGTLTGTTLASNVVSSSLTSVGTLSALTVSADATFNGVRIGKGSGGFSSNTVVGNLSLDVASGAGGQNTAVGQAVLHALSSGSDNTAVGYASLNGITTGNNNVAIGASAMGAAGTSASNNVAIGYNAMGGAHTGQNHVVIGYQALLDFTGSSSTPNTIIGQNTGRGITTGNGNTIIGAQVTGLSATLANNVILANGGGVVVFQYDGTNTTLAGGTVTTSNDLFVTNGKVLVLGTAGKISFDGVGSSGTPRNYIASGGTDALELTVGAATGILGLYVFSSPVRRHLRLFGSMTMPGGTSGFYGIGITDTPAAPTSNPAFGGCLYSQSGAGKWIGTSGTVTTFGPAEPHCPVCGSDFGHEWQNDKFGGTLQVCMKCLVQELAPNRPYIRFIPK